MIRHDDVKYLGVIVDKQLNWRKHIESVRRKCLSALAVLYRVKRTLPPKLRKDGLYQSIVLSHLDYCAIVWTKCSLGRMPQSWSECRRKALDLF